MKNIYSHPACRDSEAMSFRNPIRPFVFFILLLTTMASAACRKNTDCKGTITVVDSLNAPVQGAAVRVKYGVIDETQSSDASGKTHFTLQYPATLDVFLDGNDLHQTIRLEEGKTTELTVER